VFLDQDYSLTRARTTFRPPRPPVDLRSAGVLIVGDAARTVPRIQENGDPLPVGLMTIEFAERRDRLPVDYSRVSGLVETIEEPISDILTISEAVVDWRWAHQTEVLIRARKGPSPEAAPGYAAPDRRVSGATSVVEVEEEPFV